MKREKALESFGRLLDVMDRLREECPWDREQTMESLRPLTIEETYELSEAIIADDSFNVSKELGDLLLHIVFYAKIADEKGLYDIADVADRLCDKLIYRHPHVFGATEVEGAGDVVKNWEQLKRKEKDGNKSVLSGVPSSMPSLVKAYRIQDKARAVGFDWEKREDVWAKVKEELREFEELMISDAGVSDDVAGDSVDAVGVSADAGGASGIGDDVNSEDITGSSDGAVVDRGSSLKLEGRNVNVEGRNLNVEGGNGGRLEEEFGDLLFSLVNAARLWNINPDTALENTNRKFVKRFNYIERIVKERGLNMGEVSLEEMDVLWNEAKSEG
jgi:XTP/dITP diphosphohydrolase